MSGFRKPLTITRHSGGSIINGYWVGVDEDDEDIVIQASVQPAPGNVRKNPPEGYDIDSAYVLYTDTELYSAVAEGQLSDSMTLFGSMYHVVAVEPWQNDVLPHYEVTVARPTIQSE